MLIIPHDTDHDCPGSEADTGAPGLVLPPVIEDQDVISLPFRLLLYASEEEVVFASRIGREDVLIGKDSDDMVVVLGLQTNLLV